MTIDSRCREQQKVADRIFMDFKYTAPGSDDQLRALQTLNVLISLWGDYLSREEFRRASTDLSHAR